MRPRMARAPLSNVVVVYRSVLRRSKGRCQRLPHRMGIVYDYEGSGFTLWIANKVDSQQADSCRQPWRLPARSRALSRPAGCCALCRTLALRPGRHREDRPRCPGLAVRGRAPCAWPAHVVILGRHHGRGASTGDDEVRCLSPAGASAIPHSGEDERESQPAGNRNARVARTPALEP